MRYIVLMILLLALPLSVQAGKKEERQAKERAAVQELLARAESGDVKARFAYGLMLLQGKMVEKDQARGIGMLEQAAESGDGTAIAALYDTYEKGRYGVPKNPEQADYWARKGGIVSPRIQAENEKLLREELDRQAAEGSLAASTIRAAGEGSPDLDVLEKNALAGDKTACALLFDLHMKGKYAPGAEVEAAMAKHGLLTKEKIDALAAEAKGK
jgi:TPR repeat protein